MNLNDLERFKQIDTQGMIDHINKLPDQLAEAWELGQKADLPEWEGITQVLIAGMGGSAIGGDLLAAYIEPMSTTPVVVYRDYGLPNWAKSENTLVICSSHSGNTEEILSVFDEAAAADCKLLAITTGGQLAEKAGKHGAAVCQYTYDFQPRAAVGYSFGLLLAVFSRLGLIPDPAGEVAGAVAAMKEQQKTLVPEVPDTGNLAKRMGGQLMGRWVTIWGAGLLAPVARRWKTQINEIAKAQANFELLPEADHNTLQAVVQPEGEFGATMNVFLRASRNHPRNKLREEFTRMSFMLAGQNTDFIKASGGARLADMWTVLHYGDYTAYYLAMAYGVDPTPVPMLAELKEKMKAAE